MRRSQAPRFLPILLCIGLLLTACNTLTISGRIAVKGSEPVSYVVMITREGDLSIVGSLKDEIKTRYQGRYLKVRGKIVTKERGPGFPAELDVSQILEIDSKPF